MSGDEKEEIRRHSKAYSADLVEDEWARKEAEARNGLRQTDALLDMIDYYLDPERPFRLRPSMILHLQRIALDGLSAYAGNFRPGPVEIEQSQHQPPQAHLVAEYVEDMCNYVNEQWQTASAVHLAAYVMWRLNWIHPFADGNGRTSRAVSYLVLCVHLGYRLPGSNTIPYQIAQNRRPYFDAIDAADAAAAKNELDVSEMEKLIESLLANQLYGVLKDARGAQDTET
jgi:Fic family protein